MAEDLRARRGPGREPAGRTARVEREEEQAVEPRRHEPRVGERVRQLCPDAAKVINRLNRWGFQSYLCGGCVRDLLLDLRPKDFDIATDATPRQIKRLFRNSRIIGRRFRLVQVTFPSTILEVSTFRSLVDQPAAGADLLIHQDNVFGTAEEDARRRDFTINGLFYDLATSSVLDHVGGLADLDRRMIETIGDPWVRFREDPVRMLRAVKFASRLGFVLADDVYEAVVDCREDVLRAAPPRVLEEILRLMNLGGAREATRLLFKTGLLEMILPELAAVLDELGSRPDRTAFRDYWSTLGAFDKAVRAGAEAGNPRVLAILLSPLFEKEMGEGTPIVVRPDQDDALTPIATRLRMARRDAYRARQILHAQRRFLRGADPRKRRPTAAHALGRDYFQDAFFFLKLRAEASGGMLAEAVTRWNEQIEAVRVTREE